MVERKVKDTIIFDFMAELGRHDCGDRRDNVSADMFMEVLKENKRVKSPLLLSFELFWKNPLFFGKTRNYIEVMELVKQMPTTHRTNILATVYKTYASIYEKEPVSDVRTEYHYQAVRHVQRYIKSTAKKKELFRLNVPHMFLIIEPYRGETRLLSKYIKQNKAMEEEFKKTYRKYLFKQFKKYEQNPLKDNAIIDKYIMPFL
jgi:hypothetical protein